MVFRTKNQVTCGQSDKKYLVVSTNEDKVVDLLLARVDGGAVCGYRKTAEQMSLWSLLNMVRDKSGLNGGLTLVPMDDFKDIPANKPISIREGLDMDVLFKELNRLFQIVDKYEPEELLDPLKESFLGKVYSLFAVPFYMLTYPTGVLSSRKETSYSVPSELSDAISEVIRTKVKHANQEVFVSRQIQPVRKLIADWAEFRTQAEEALRDHSRYIRHVYDTQVTEAGDEGIPMFGFTVGISQDLTSPVLDMEKYFRKISGVDEVQQLDFPRFNEMLNGVAGDAYCPQCWLMQPKELARLDYSIVNAAKASLRGEPLPVPANLKGIKGKFVTVRHAVSSALRGCFHINGDEL